MILQSSNFNCVASAISTVRLALGYEEPFEPGIPLQYPTYMGYLLKYKNRFFPRHKTVLYFTKQIVSEFFKSGEMALENWCPFLEEFQFKPTDSFICIFDYRTINSEIPMSHTVIGFPTYFNGMVGQYILQVYLNYQLELGI